VDKVSPGAASRGNGRERLLSLDVLRGLTVALMILVNNAGDGTASYAQLRHSKWNGCTLTDVVFPTFLFIVGASIALAFDKRRGRGASRGSILLQVLKRSAMIAAIGLLLNAPPSFHLDELRYYGVLQRIALCYLLASMVYLAGGVWGSLGVTVGSLIGYWWLLLRVPVPGFGLPGVTVGVLDQAGNLASWLDRAMVPAAHLYHHGNYDPEGLLSTLPALATTLLGVLAIRWLQTSRGVEPKAAWLSVSGVVLLAGGLVWARSFPINKRLWTSSYVLFTAGIAMILFALLYWLIDGRFRVRRGLGLWLVFGSNALTAYCLSEVLAMALSAVPLAGGGNLQQGLFRWLRGVLGLLPGWPGPLGFASLVYSILFVLVCALPVLYLYRRGIFLKL
jgi:predicted acyltransferase